jgi:hypothetical protein
MDRSAWPVRRTTLRGDSGDDPKILDAEARVAMMWTLTCDAWTFLGEPVVEPRLQRHVVRLVRGRG